MVFRFEYHMFYVLYPFVSYLLTLPRIYVPLPSSELVKHILPAAVTLTTSVRPLPVML
jgi:hypothetical protein